MTPPKTETPLMLEAFNHFVKLGKERSLVAVQKQFRKSNQWVMVVSKAFKWWDRAAEFDKKQADSDLDDYATQLKQSNRDNLIIIRALRRRFAENINNRRVPVTPSDFERLAKLERLILGEATERTEELTVTGIVKRAADDKRTINISPKN